MVVNAGFHFVDFFSTAVSPRLAQLAASMDNFTLYQVGSSAPHCKSRQDWKALTGALTHDLHTLDLVLS